MILLLNKRFVLSAHCDKIFKDSRGLNLFTPIPTPIFCTYKDRYNRVFGLGLQWILHAAYIQICLPIDNAPLKKSLFDN